MRIAILGGGISGLIAEGCFQGHDIEIFDPKESVGFSDEHKAVMRLRNDKIKDYINCSLEKVTAYKAVYHEGKLYDRSNIMLNNLYSLKAYGSLGERSLKDLGRVERYLLKSAGPLKSGRHRRSKILRISDKVIHGALSVSAAYDICISTIPMPALLSILRIDHNIHFSHTHIYVARATLSIESAVHQTIYFTAQALSTPYRVTIEGKNVIAESIMPIEEAYFGRWLEPFGLSVTDIESFEQFEQPFGKMKPIDDPVRKKIMKDLTDKHNIYSFGRFATWRPLRVDQTLDDIEKIKMFIKIRDIGYYEDI